MSDMTVRGWRWFAATCGTFAIAACAPQGPVSPAVPPELKHSWEVAFNRGDADTIVALYAPDAQLIMPGAEPVRGREGIRAAVVEMIKSGVKVKIDTEENIGSGSVAYVYGPYRVADAQGRVVEQGRYVETWRKDGGTWRIDVDINTAGPPEASKSPNAPP
jgi:uncharacterized protein (TIGR02246 family)